MREHDETPYFVIEREGGGGIGAFVLGALVGAGLALLFAPQSGEETQEELRSRAAKLKDQARDRVRGAQENLEGRLSSAREHVGARVESVKEAVDSGRKAALEARDELERKLERAKAAYRAGIEAAKEVEAPEGSDARPESEISQESSEE